MSSTEPVLDWRGLCCPDENGEGLCNPITCSCGPELHLTQVVDPDDGPDGDPDDTGETPTTEIRARLDAAVEVIREMRGLAPDARVPDVLLWTPEEIAAAMLLAYPDLAPEVDPEEGSQ